MYRTRRCTKYHVGLGIFRGLCVKIMPKYTRVSRCVRAVPPLTRLCGAGLDNGDSIVRNRKKRKEKTPEKVYRIKALRRRQARLQEIERYRCRNPINIICLYDL